MWSGVLSFLKALLLAISSWQNGRQREADRQAGRDETFNHAQWEILDRAKTAEDIRDKHRRKRLLQDREGGDK